MTKNTKKTVKQKSTKSKKMIISLTVAATIALVVAGVLFYKSRPKVYSDIDRINMGIHAISKMVKKDGRIVYNIDFLTNKKDKKNNIVREMGTTYALAFAFNQTHDPKLQKKLVPVLAKTRDRCISVGENACMISDNPDKLKVGSTALALLAELFYEKTSGDMQFADLREKWTNAILNLYVKDKGVMVSPQKQESSPYFDGESWFALSVYHDLYPNNERVAKTVSSLDETMFKIYQDHYLISFVHWGLMSAAQRYGTTHDKKFLDFMKKQFQLYVQENPEPRRGSSTCSVSEGLGDVVYFVNHDDIDFARQVMERINQNKIKIDDLQVISTKVVGPNAKKYPTIHEKTEKYIGAFKNTPDSYKTRNDITQHCLTALLKRQRAMKVK